MTKGLKLITKVIGIRMPLITFNMYKPKHPGIKLTKHCYDINTGEGIIRLSGLTFNPDTRMNITQNDMDEELSRISKFITDDNPRRTIDNKRPINKPSDFWSKNIAWTSIPGLSNQYDYIKSRMVNKHNYYVPLSQMKEIETFYERNNKIFDGKLEKINNFRNRINGIDFVIMEQGEVK